MGSPLEAPFSDERPFRRGDAIDRFTVLETLGMGGMGVVVSAYDVTLDRKVAIKVLRPDRLAVDPVESGARLRREAQAMSRLMHPNVITVHEVGTIGDQVFVAMELVEGGTLTSWLATARRTWREVVNMFVRAGRGLAAAHRAGLVHRDFKPDNVLVGADGEVRVTDFGLACVSTESPSTSSAGILDAQLTRTGAVMGTPAYMSPEQYRGDPVDARSDQFSFCVALYEALYGVRPFAGADAAEVQDAIAARRLSPPTRETPRRLRALIHRGLEARPDDRWPDMESLIEELARDPTAVRRRWLLGGGAIAAAAVLGAAVLVRDGPVLCQGASERAAVIWDSARPRVQAAFLATGSPIAADVFARVDRLLGLRLAGWSDAYTDACEATRVRGEQSEAMLDLRMQCLERARRQIGSLVDLWQRDPVDLEKAIEAANGSGDVRVCADTEALAMPVAPPADPEIARRIDQVRARLDAVEAHERAGQLARALSLARDVVGAARALGYAPIVAEALYRDGALECESGKLETGISLLHDAALAAAEARDDVLYARILSELVFQIADKGGASERSAAALPFATAAVARVGHRDEAVADLLEAEGALLTRNERFADALARLQKALLLREQRLGADHPEVALLLHGIARSLERLDRLDESLQLHRRVLAMRERTSGPDHPAVADTASNLAIVLREKGQLDEASGYLERALAIREKVFSPGHRTIGLSLHRLGVLRTAQGRPAEAFSLYERAEKIRVTALGPDHPETLKSRMNLALATLNLGDTAKARSVMETVIPAVTRVHGENSGTLATAWRHLGLAYLEEENWKGAETAFSRALAIRRKLSRGQRELTEILVNLGQVRIGQRRYPEAIALIEEAKANDEHLRGERSVYRTYILTALGKAYLGAGRVARALATLEQSAAIAEKAAGEETFPEKPVIHFELARALWASGARVRAATLARDARRALTDPELWRERARVENWLRARRLRR